VDDKFVGESNRGARTDQWPSLQSRALEQQAYRQQFELEDEHWWFRGRRAVIWALLARAGVTGPGREVSGSLRVLDAGCGTGRNLLEFGALGSAQGVEISSEAIEFCAARGIRAVAQAPIESMPFDDASFDLVLATDVIEHLDDDRAALTELNRVAAPGARMLVTVPAYKWLWGPHDEIYHHQRRYTLSRLRAAVIAGGWIPVVDSYFNSLLLAPAAAVRLAARVRPAARDQRLDVDLTPRALNRVLLAPLELEATLIRRGVRLPAGLSIGIVCRAGTD
jgi:SAM-dependent methyltransferase